MLGHEIKRCRSLNKAKGASPHNQDDSWDIRSPVHTITPVQPFAEQCLDSVTKITRLLISYDPQDSSPTDPQLVTAAPVPSVLRKEQCLGVQAGARLSTALVSLDSAQCLGYLKSPLGSSAPVLLEEQCLGNPFPGLFSSTIAETAGSAAPVLLISSEVQCLGNSAHASVQTKSGTKEPLSLEDQFLTSDGFTVVTNRKLAKFKARLTDLPIEVLDELPSWDILGVLETRIKEPHADAIVRRRFRHFRTINNYDHHSNGRIWVFWKAALAVTLGANQSSTRHHLWAELCKSPCGSLPWLVLGDFNYVLSISERLSSCDANLNDIADFSDCLLTAGLSDLNATGNFFTWTNKQDAQDRKWLKLDRALVNREWVRMFPDANAEFLPAGLSDHSPVLVLLNLAQKIKAKLKLLNHEKYSAITSRAVEAKNALNCRQVLLQQNPLDAVLLLREEELRAIYCRLKKAELSALAQRAKIHDIKLTDGSTSYFYAKLTERRNINSIASIQDVTGLKCSSIPGISNAFLGYYQSLLGTDNSPGAV